MIYSSLPHGKALCVLEHGDISHIGIKRAFLIKLFLCFQNCLQLFTFSSSLLELFGQFQ